MRGRDLPAGCSSSKTWQLNCRDKYGDTNHKIVCVGRRETCTGGGGGGGICVNRDHMRE